VSDAPASARRPWRDNLEALTMAVAMAIFLKVFVIEAYKIPTGSMQPTLIGDERAGLFDRVLVDKLSFALRDPERWEVVVFKYPLDLAKAFVKRLVGIGPEDLRIEYGDLWHRRDAARPWEILRRPRAVMDDVWKALDDDEPADPSWSVVEDGSEWRCEARTILARGNGLARFRPERGPILDHYLDGYGPALRARLDGPHFGSGQYDVGDLRVDGWIEPLPGCLALAVELEEGPRRYVLRLPGPGAPAGERPSIRADAGSETPARWAQGVPRRFEAGVRQRFAAQNLDDRLELELDGRTLCALDVEPSRDQRSAVNLRVSGAGADLGDLRVRRDIYYTTSNAKAEFWSIPAGSYFCLGDNTQDSSDGREWSFVRYAIDDSSGAGRIVRGNSRRGENPIKTGFGEEDGPKLRLRDEFGETHWFRQDESNPLSPEEAPFVPRRLIQGRAVAVFWPLDPFAKIYRWKWVH
jgi:hypothetical protein